MSNYSYYLFWLGAGLLIIAVASALITRHLRLRVLRRLKAIEMLDAVSRYSEWVAAQRHGAVIQASAPDGETPLREVLAGGQQWLPELRAQMQELLAVHTRLTGFLASQHQLRLEDPEAWLDSDHDARFAQLWHEHLLQAQGITAMLTRIASVQDVEPERGTTFPA